MKGTLIFLSFLISFSVVAQTESIFVPPFKTDDGYCISQNSHLIVTNTSASIDKLFLFLGGTGSSTRIYNRLSTFTAGLGFDDSVHVDNIDPPYEQPRCLYTTQKPGLALINHNSTIKFSQTNNDVWEYMLTSFVASTTTESEIYLDYIFYPNPTHNYINVAINNQIRNKYYSIFNLNGKQVLSGQFINAGLQSIDVSSLECGLFFIFLDQFLYKIIKY